MGGAAAVAAVAGAGRRLGVRERGEGRGEALVAGLFSEASQRRD